MSKGVISMSALDDLHQANKPTEDRELIPSEADMDDTEWVDYKLANWNNAMQCSDSDKGKIMKWIVVNMREVMNK